MQTCSAATPGPRLASSGVVSGLDKDGLALTSFVAREVVPIYIAPT